MAGVDKPAIITVLKRVADFVSAGEIKWEKAYDIE
jgi:hypothetical protein